jgi:large-conductance mechanosensitive channel
MDWKKMLQAPVIRFVHTFIHFQAFEWVTCTKCMGYGMLLVNLINFLLICSNMFVKNTE